MIDTSSYDLAGDLLSESFTGGPLNGLSVINGYDLFLRRTNLTALSASVLSRTLYGYDGASRLATVSDGTNTATYTYLANSPLVSQIIFSASGTTRMTTTKTYDYLNRLTQISSAPSAAYTLPLTYNYTYNPANQRTKDTLADGSYWVYGYDSLGQVTNGCKYFANGTLVPGQQFDYAFDTIGNRTNTQTGGDTNGANLRLANYHANSLNQITNRDVPPYVDIMGASILTNTVTVNGQTAARIQEYYRAQIPANNASTALWTNVTVTDGQTVSGNVYVPKQPELFKYDADGNLTNDGRWYYSWDAENRLIGMTNYTGVGPAYKLAFNYDPKGRRIQKVVATNAMVFTTNNFLYDGWNLIAVLSTTSQLQSSFMWGADLSGSTQGAGGVGGLLKVGYSGASTTNSFVAYDGNGNITALISAVDATFTANYEYGPFGEGIRSTGPMATANPIRFSSKYDDDESDLQYYGYRYYKPSTGTWLSRDPIEEAGGFNIYAIVNNQTPNNFDSFGLFDGWDDVLSCVWTFAQESIDDFFTKALVCGEAYDQFETAYKDPNGNGFTFPSDTYDGYQPSSDAAKIAKCIFNKAKGMTIDQIVKKIKDPIERKMVKELLDKGTDVDDPKTDFGGLVRAKCVDGQLQLTIQPTVTVTVGKQSKTSPVGTVIGPFSCPLLHLDKYCSCTPDKKKKATVAPQRLF